MEFQLLQIETVVGEETILRVSIFAESHSGYTPALACEMTYRHESESFVVSQRGFRFGGAPMESVKVRRGFLIVMAEFVVPEQAHPEALTLKLDGGGLDNLYG